MSVGGVESALLVAKKPCLKRAQKGTPHPFKSMTVSSAIPTSVSPYTEVSWGIITVITTDYNRPHSYLNTKLFAV